MSHTIETQAVSNGVGIITLIRKHVQLQMRLYCFYYCFRFSFVSYWLDFLVRDAQLVWSSYLPPIHLVYFKRNILNLTSSSNVIVNVVNLIFLTYVCLTSMKLWEIHKPYGAWTSAMAPVGFSKSITMYFLRDFTCLYSFLSEFNALVLSYESQQQDTNQPFGGTNRTRSIWWPNLYFQ